MDHLLFLACLVILPAQTRAADPLIPKELAVERMEEASHDLGATIAAPFMTMSFMALSVIPELKITDRGLVDTVRFELVPLEA